MGRVQLAHDFHELNINYYSFNAYISSNETRHLLIISNYTYFISSSIMPTKCYQFTFVRNKILFLLIKIRLPYAMKYTIKIYGKFVNYLCLSIWFLITTHICILLITSARVKYLLFSIVSYIINKQTENLSFLLYSLRNINLWDNVHLSHSISMYRMTSTFP